MPTTASGSQTSIHSSCLRLHALLPFLSTTVGNYLEEEYGDEWEEEGGE